MPRGSSPGERRGGRQKGTPNKVTQEIVDKLRALGCDPIEGMARIAMDPESKPELRLKAYVELAQYVALLASNRIWVAPGSIGPDQCLSLIGTPGSRLVG